MLHPVEEAATVQAFFLRGRRARWTESLASDKRRARMLDRLNLCRDLDPRFAVLLPFATDVLDLLRLRDAPAACQVMSAAEALDGRRMPRDDAITATRAAGWGTIIICIPARLAYYHDELGERQMLLQRTFSRD